MVRITTYLSKNRAFCLINATLEIEKHCTVLIMENKMAANMMNFEDSLHVLKYGKFYSKVDESSKKLRTLASEAADALSHFKSKPPQLDALIDVFRTIKMVPIERITESLDEINIIYLDLTQKITQTNIVGEKIKPFFQKVKI